MLSNSVSKLGIYVWCFNLPRSTCLDYRTRLCNISCYAKRGNFSYPYVQKAMQHNLKQSKEPLFWKRVCLQIENIILDTGVKRIRLHSSGEFYDKQYYKKWVKVTKSFPDIKFLAYTRNTDIDFSTAPNNFVIYFSVDESTRKTNKSCKLKSYLDTTSTGVSKHLARHPTIENGYICNSHCHECTYCWKGVKNIVFYKNMAARMAQLKKQNRRYVSAGQLCLPDEKLNILAGV